MHREVHTKGDLHLHPLPIPGGLFINQTLDPWQDIKGDKFELPLSKVNVHPLPSTFPRRVSFLHVVASVTAPSVRSFCIMQSNGKETLAQLR